MRRRSFLAVAFTVIGSGMLRLLGFQRASAETNAVSIAAPVHPWATVDFEYEAAGRTFPGTVVRLPETLSGGLYAACRICPHQGCTFGYEINYQQVGDIVGVDLANPVFFCRCHLSVYDPAQDGRVISGPAPRPPWRFSIRETGDRLTVTGIEPGAGDMKS